MAEGLKEAGAGGDEGKSAPVEEKPAKAAPPVETKPPVKSEEKPAKKEEPAAAKSEKAEKAEKEPKQIGEDDDIPEDSELLSMSKQALAKRLDRHTKKELRDRFGTDDPAKIKKDLEELATLRSEKDAKRRAEMSELEKAKEDLAKEKKAREEAEAKAQRQVDQQTFAEYDSTAKEVFEGNIAPKHMKRASRELKEHILSLDEAETPADAKKAKKVFEKWMKGWLEENPEFAKAKEEEPKRIPLTTGSNPNAKREKSDASLTQKTAKPGQVNSMTKAEYNAYKRERGLS